MDTQHLLHQDQQAFQINAFAAAQLPAAGAVAAEEEMEWLDAIDKDWANRGDGSITETPTKSGKRPKGSRVQPGTSKLLDPEGEIRPSIRQDMRSTVRGSCHEDE